MAPKYNPLQAIAPTGIIAADFNIQAQDFTDAEKIQAALRAQELANQQNEIAVQNNQQRFDNQNQLRQALQEQYGSLPEGEQFDPNAALDKAREIAFGQGDLDTALSIERAQKERHGALPLSQDLRDFYGKALPDVQIPEGATVQDINAFGTLQRGNIYGQSVRETADKRNDTLQSYAPGGFQAVIDPTTGQGPNATDGKKFTETVRAHSRINGDLDALEDSLSRGGGNDPFSPEYARQKAILSDIAIALKAKNEFGAALTPNEEKLNNAVLPAILARQDIGIGDALVANGMGRDPSDAIKTMRGLFSTDFDQQAAIYKFRPTGKVGLPLAQSGTSFRIPGGMAPEVTDALSRAGAGSAPPPLSNYGVPRNADGSIFSREQFREQFRAQRRGGGR